MSRVLIVDDKEENRCYLEALFVGHGFTAEAVRHGAEALTVARQTPPDLVIADLLMPVMDGYTLLRHWKADARLKNIPFIVYTATYTSAEDERLALNLGADAFILKPAEPEDFLERVRVVQARTAIAAPQQPNIPAGSESGLLKVYSETLIRKLEEKTLEQEETNRVLQQDIAKRMQIEDSLRASEARFRAIVENEPECVKVVSADGLLLDMNPAGLCMLEADSKAQVIGGVVAKLVHPEDLAAFLDLHKRVIQGETGQLQFRMIGLKGTERWMETHSAPLREADGSVGSVLSVTRDITAQKEAATEIMKTTALLKAVADGTPDAVFLKDVKGRYLLCNEAAARFVGRTVEAVLGQDDTALFNAEDAQLVMDNDRKVMDSGQAQTTEEVLTAAGLTRTYLATKAPYRDAQGKVIGLIGISRDITERKRAEEALRQKDALLRIAGKITRTGGWALDIPSGGMFWSDEIFDILELPRGALPHLAEALAMYPQPERDQINAVLENCGKDGQPFDLETECLTGSGRRISVRICGEAEHHANGTIIRVHGAFQDISERKNLEKQFLRAQRMESIGTLAGGIAHDLNNVLAPIMMSIDLLKLQEKDPQRLGILNTIEGSAKRGADMVSQVLSFARGVEGQHISVQIGSVIGEIEKITNETFFKNIQVRNEVAVQPWTVLGDPTQLHQVLLNLCVNARDAMPGGGVLTLSASNLEVDQQYAGMNLDARPGPYVVVQVEDTGTGMPAEVTERIFEPFYTTKEPGKGTGLGLSTSLAIIKSHGGFIRVYSEVGVGTKFKVYLPAYTETRPAPKTPAETPLPRGNNELILVVDDEAPVRHITQQTLEAFGYRVLLASDGAEATAIYASRQLEIDIVLTDMMMPVMDGPTTILVLMRMNPEVRIIAASGLNVNGMVAKAASAGVKKFIPKPYTAETLLRSLRDVLSTTPGENRQKR